MTEQPRPVWLTRSQLETIAYLADTVRTDVAVPLHQVVAAWDAAPADPAEAVLRATWPHGWLDPADAPYRKSALANANAVLRALGMP